MERLHDSDTDTQEQEVWWWTRARKGGRGKGRMGYINTCSNLTCFVTDPQRTSLHTLKDTVSHDKPQFTEVQTSVRIACVDHVWSHCLQTFWEDHAVHILLMRRRGMGCTTSFRACCKTWVCGETEHIYKGKKRELSEMTKETSCPFVSLWSVTLLHKS